MEDCTIRLATSVAWWPDPVSQHPVTLWCRTWGTRPVTWFHGEFNWSLFIHALSKTMSSSMYSSEFVYLLEMVSGVCISNIDAPIIINLMAILNVLIKTTVHQINTRQAGDVLEMYRNVLRCWYILSQSNVSTIWPWHKHCVLCQHLVAQPINTQRFCVLY